MAFGRHSCRSSDMHSCGLDAGNVMEEDPKVEMLARNDSYGLHPLTLPHVIFKQEDWLGAPALAWNCSISLEQPSLSLISCASLSKFLNLSEPLVPATVKCRSA